MKATQNTLFYASGDDIWKPRSYWAEMDERDISQYVDRIFSHYRKVGYPHQDHRQQAAAVMSSLCSSAGRLAEVAVDGSLKFHMHALGLCWSYHRHAISVRCNGHRSVMDAFNDDEFLRKTIRKCLKRSESMSDNHFRETIRNMAGVQKPSNFRPMAAASVYSTVAKFAGRSLRVWDMCGGYGGRMLGAAASKSVSHYSCNEPCAATRSGLLEMYRDISKSADWFLADVSSLPAEDAAVGRWDFCFTSPPYWDTERYSEEPSQSCVRYGNYLEWIDGFLVPMMRKALDGLSEDGILAINVAATKRCPTLPGDVLAVAKSLGASLICFWKYLLGATTRGGMKYEPVFVFARHKADWHQRLPGYTTHPPIEYAEIARQRVEVAT